MSAVLNKCPLISEKVNFPGLNFLGYKVNQQSSNQYFLISSEITKIIFVQAFETNQKKVRTLDMKSILKV
jgi:hypothetical protein